MPPLYRVHPGQATYDFCNFFDKHCAQGTISVFPGKGNETDTYLPDSLQAHYFTLDRVKQTLHQLYSDRGFGWLPAQPSDVYNNCKRILAVLLYIGRGDRIEFFVQKPELYDEKLPFFNRPPSFPDSTVDSFFEKFQQAQWKFCAPKIDDSRRVDWDSRVILPFVRIGEPLGKGHSGKAYRIKVHPAHDQLRRGPAANSTHGSQSSNEYVLKTFHPRPGSEAVWCHEVEAHIALREAHRPDNGIVWFHNCYTHGKTCNVILEHAPHGDLEKLLLSLKRPTTNEDIMLFWRRFLGLVETLAFLRDMRYEDKSAYQLCHFDIKPRNILVFPGGTDSLYDLHFKFGDFGSSNFQVMRNDDQAYTEYYPGTRTFGAPECYNWKPFSDKMKTPQNVLPDADMWSLGAIAAEIATWMHSGYAGIKVADCFHNGKDILDCVDSHLEELTNDADVTNAEVIRLIRKHMLVAKPENRMHARHLQYEADNALSAVQQRIDITKGLTETNKAGRALDRRQTVPPQGKQSPHSHGNAWPPFNQATQSAPDQIANLSTDNWQGAGRHPVLKTNLSYVDNSSPTGNHPTIGPSGCHERSSHLASNNPYRNRPATTPIIHQHVRPPPPPPPDPFVENGVPSRQFPRLHEVPIPNGMHSASKSMGQSKNPWPSGPIRHDPLGIGVAQGQKYLAVDQSSFDESTLSDGVKTPTSDPERSSGPALNTDENTMKDPKGGNGRVSIQIPGVATQDSEAGLQQKTNPDVPFLSYDDAIESLRSIPVTRGKFKRHSRGSKPEERMLKEYKKRDFIILVDDSTSMRPHWSKVVDSARLIAQFTTPYDHNGVEVRFMSDYKLKTTTKDVQRIRSLVEDHQPREEGKIFSLVNDVLDCVLGGYRETLEKERSMLGRLRTKAKTLIVFVLTDGEFCEYCNAKGPIKDLVGTLRHQMRPNNQVGVQFVRFGNNATAKARLDDLDDFLNPNVNRTLAADDTDNKDIVDVEPWDGVNVWKLLLGSINRLYDRSDLPSSSFHLTPVTSPVAELGLQSPGPPDCPVASSSNFPPPREVSNQPGHRQTYPPPLYPGYQHPHG